MARPKRVRKIFQPVVIVVAAVYFVIDALALSSLKPLLRKIANLKLFNFIARWIASLGPYATLSLFMVPLILLEPVKPKIIKENEFCFCAPKNPALFHLWAEKVPENLDF